MSRLAVVTGSAGGIGAATATTLEAEGYEVIGVDIAGAEITADLSTPGGRSAMVEAVTERTGGTLDVLVANAGVMNTAEMCLRVNYFGAVATLEGLAPLLARGESPRAVVTVSSSILNVQMPAVVEACLAGDEAQAIELASAPGAMDMAGYPTSKYALARWLRRSAIGDAWAGAGIALNGVAPGIVQTNMTAEMLAHEDSKELADASVPMPFGGYCHPQHVADVIAFLASARPTRICGQILFVDGGADVVLRGDDIWHTAAI
ncbi:MAG: SDR family oxidoreductase [Microthrixaceae bacterium]|nr:SDR family oxidoreductase [Microthrixaceae bacterium]